MGTKENGHEREELKQNKDAESDYEPARDSLSSQGEAAVEDTKVKRASRVPKNFTKKELAENNNVRSRRGSTDRREQNRLHFNSQTDSSRRKSEKATKVPSKVKTAPKEKMENGNGRLATRASSVSSEGSDERILDDKAIEEVKEIDISEEAPNCDQSGGTDNETVDTEENSLEDYKENPYQKIEELESRIDKLEEELREVAALEISLYSMVPEHGSSAHKVHTPARRLSRLYIHACKHWTLSKRATVAKNSVSGLVLIAKSCGNDVARLTYWLSNTVVLREIISQAFGHNVSSSFITMRLAESNGIATKADSRSPTNGKASYSNGKLSAKPAVFKLVEDWQETSTFVSALARIESWMFSRVVESVWWQTLTPHMQAPDEDSYKAKGPGKLLGPALGDQQQGAFSINLWKEAFHDAFSRICPVRAAGHECGCLPVLAKLVMEHCVARLDVAMFNAILRESANQIPTDPVSDPIVDAKVLPIPAGDLSFGSGAQLKNAIGNWSRWLADVVGIDTDDSSRDEQDDESDDQRSEAESKCFRLLNSLSDLLMLPKDMLLDKSIRKEVCPHIGLSLITRILCNFTPDEFCPDPVPGIVLEELNEEKQFEKDSTSFPYPAAAVVYCPPSAAHVAEKAADAGGKDSELGRSASMIQRRGYTSDDDLDDLDSPLSSIIDKTPPVSPANNNGSYKGNSQSNLRFELLREVWSA